MSLPDTDSLPTFGGALKDYSPVVDATTDRAAAGANQAYADTAFASHLVPRCAARVTLSSGAPVLVSRDEGWNNGLNAVPAYARTTNGIYTATYPTTVMDEIPAGLPGYNAAGHILNLRYAWAIALVGTGSTGWVDCKAVVTAANVITLYFYLLSAGVPALADPTAAITDVIYFGI